MYLKKSKEYLTRANKVIPSMSQTFSKGPSQWPSETSPNFLSRGNGAWVWDVDGNKYLDYLMALGPIILGYNNPEVNAAVMQQIKDGPVFSQMHPLEVEVSELLVDIIPCAEMVRFGKNGSDVTSSAIRAARAYTGRDRIGICGYHGWQDWYIGTTTRNLGVPKAVQELSHTFNYNDLNSLSQLFEKYSGEFAAVIMEPVGVELPEDGFLFGVKELCHQHGVLLIFDEIVTGFRLSLGGAQELFGVIPDIACFGKAMANGLPLSAVVGRKDIMSVFDKIFFSGTFGGETFSLAACKATIETLRNTDALTKIHNHGKALWNFLEDSLLALSINTVIMLKGQPARFVLTFPADSEDESLLRRTYFMQECIKRGLLYYCVNIPTASHGSNELEFSKGVLEEVLILFSIALKENSFASRIVGKPISSIFRKP